MNINFRIIADSLEFYEDRGYKRIKTPWTVTKAVSDITKPKDAQDWTIKEKNKVLVASAEQGFLYLCLKGFLPKGRYQSCGPCFRDDSFSNTHSKYFIKNELFITSNVCESVLLEAVGNAANFFKKYTDGVEMVKTESGYDLVKGNIELGSYGIRTCSFAEWVYGTAVAEPRFSSTLNIF